MELKLEDLVVGKTYRAKRPAKIHPLLGGGFNDRTIVWRGYDEGERTRIQYDGPSVQDGRHYPKVSAAAFLKWAKEEVNNDQPTD